MYQYLNIANKDNASYKYWSTTITVNRGCWFYDFAKVLFGRFVERREESLPKVA